MATVQEIREGIDDRLATIAGLRHSANVPKSPNPAPEGGHAYVKRRTTTFGVSMDGEDDVTFAVTVVVSWAEQQKAQVALDQYLASTGAKSIKAAIDADPTLGGIVDYAHATQVEDERITVFVGVEYLAADIVVEVG
jgi:hypothetical protein